MEQEIKAENRVPCSERDCCGLKPGKVGKRQVAVQRALGKARVCEEEEKTLEIPKSYGMTLQEKKEILKKGGGGYDGITGCKKKEEQEVREDVI